MTIYNIVDNTRSFQMAASDLILGSLYNATYTSTATADGTLTLNMMMV